LVCTNRAVHEFQEPVLGNKKNLTHLNTIFYEQFSNLTRNHSGQAVHADIYTDSGKISKCKAVYVIHEYAELDIVVKNITSRAPKHGRTRTTMWLEDCHLDFLLSQAKVLLPGEKIEGSYLLENCWTMGTRHQDVYVVMTTTRMHLFLANFQYWHKLAPTSPLPWWSDKSRFMPLPDGVRGWDVRFLETFLDEPLELADITCNNVVYNDQRGHPQLILTFGGGKEDKTTSFFQSDPLKEAIVLEFISFSNCCYMEQVIKMGMIRCGAKV